MKLYVINAPSFMQNHVAHTNGDTLTPMEDPLSEHFTYLYANFLKFGLVDEVVLFPREGHHQNHKDEVLQQIEVDEKKITVSWAKDEKMYEIVNKTSDDYVYIYGLNNGYPDCSKLFGKFVIFNPMFNGITHSDNLNPKHHHFGLIEGAVYSSTVTKNIPYAVHHLTSRATTELSKDIIENTKKEYDWIMVSSFDPRKRHLEFLTSLSAHSSFKNSRGCIVGRNPANKGRVTEHTHVYSAVKSFVDQCDNVDLHVNTTLQKKIDLVLKSKIFVCVSKMDNGPRAMVEAAQCGLPMLSMPHIGSSDLILPGQTGEIVNDITSAPRELFKMLDKYEKGGYQKTIKIVDLLKPENVFPRLIEQIKNVKKINKHKH